MAIAPQEILAVFALQEWIKWLTGNEDFPSKEYSEPNVMNSLDFLLQGKRREVSSANWPTSTEDLDPKPD